MSFPKAFLEQLNKARKTGDQCDYELRCAGGVVNVHKLVIGIHSPVLKAASTGHFKENGSGFYEINDFSLRVVEKAVDYLYSGTYKPSLTGSDDGNSKVSAIEALQFHAEIFSFADKYLMGNLRTFAKDRFRKKIDTIYVNTILPDLVPLLSELEAELFTPLREILGREAYHDMHRDNYSPNMGEVISDMASKCPKFLAFFFKRTWREKCDKCYEDCDKCYEDCDSE